MSTLKVDSITNNGSAVDLTNGAFQIGGNDVVQGYTESASEPSSPTKGDLWWDTANEVLYQYLNGEFRAIGIVPFGWTVDLANVTYDNVSFSVASQAPAVRGLAFNTDGTKMYVVGSTNDTVYQYTLSAGFDLSTASYDNISFSVAGQDGGPTTVFFNPDGTKMYVAGTITDSVYQYTLSTGFDLSTASYDNVSFSVAGQEASTYGIYFNPDGTKMYIVGISTDSVYQYTLSTGFDISTASYDNVSLNANSLDTAPTGVTFNPDGTKMYVTGSGTDSVYQYTLSTGFDLSTASYDNVSFSFAGQDSNPSELRFSPDGTKMYLVGNITDTIYQYSTGL